MRIKSKTPYVTFMRVIQFFIVFSVLSLIFGCAKSGKNISNSNQSITLWPTEEGWKTSIPETQGVRSEQLTKLIRFVQEEEINLHSILMIRNGYMVLDAYFYPYTKETVHDVASVTKSITSALIGLGINKGYIENIEQPVLNYFSEAANVDSNKEKITIKNLLTMTSGFNCGYEPGEKELNEMSESEKWVQYVLDLPMAAEPGSQWSYCSGNSHLLSAIITQTTGKSMLDFAQEYLFKPLSITNVIWPSDPQEYTRGWGDLHLHPYDMAKIGYLYLNQGKWKEKQLLPLKWIESSVQTHTTISESVDYGYAWYRFPIEPVSGLYYAAGRGGQYIYVWPEKNIIVVLTGGGYDIGVIQPFLLLAIDSDQALPENSDAYQNLQNIIVSIAESPIPEPVPAFSEKAAEISGNVYKLDSNFLNLNSISMVFNVQNEAELSVSMTDSLSGEIAQFTAQVGLDNVYRLSSVGEGGLPIGAKGYWKTENEFILIYNEISNINTFEFTITFEDDKITVVIKEETRSISETFEGRLQK